MAKSDSIAALAAALAKAQGAIKGAIKDSLNPGFKSKYADLASVWDACRQQLSDNGLAVIQTTEEVEDASAVLVVTTLAHSSGEWIEGRLKIRPVKADPQGMGSALTYARRYALAAIVGIAPEDADGEAAQGRPHQGHQQASNGSNGTKSESNGRGAALTELTQLAKKAGVALSAIPAELAEVGLLPKAIPSNKWTEDQLRHALNHFRSLAEVC